LLRLPSSAAPLRRSFLAPGLKQIFFIGDGLTGTGSGSIQTFHIPAGATRLFLGTMDSYGWSNNSGSFTVDLNLSTVEVEVGGSVMSGVWWKKENGVIIRGS
jgi:hypothetical protein